MSATSIGSPKDLSTEDACKSVSESNSDSEDDPSLITESIYDPPPAAGSDDDDVHLASGSGGDSCGEPSLGSDGDSDNGRPPGSESDDDRSPGSGCDSDDEPPPGSDDDSDVQPTESDDDYVSDNDQSPGSVDDSADIQLPESGVKRVEPPLGSSNDSENDASHESNKDFSHFAACDASDTDPPSLPYSALFENDLLLLALKLKYKLTGEAVGDLTQLCNFLTGGEECVSKNKYFFDKQFANVANDFDLFYMCDLCNTYVKDHKTSKLQCTNSTCKNQDVKKRNKNTFFAYLSIENQLRDLLENHNLETLIDFGGNSRAKGNDVNCEDIYDGYLYDMSFGEPNLSLNFNSDGVPVFKSSSCGIWPILLTVNELPPNIRKDHVLLAALWFGDSKPSMNVFFEPFVNELRKLHDVGFHWTRLDKSVALTRVKALVGVCDSVARPALQGFSQYNGKYGCSFCYDPGVYIQQGDGFTRTYPYDCKSVLRTKDVVLDLAERAVAAKHAILGVKGPSILQLIPGFDIIHGMVPDYMHSVLLGVTRQLGKLWFDSTNHSEPFYISCADQKLIDFALTGIRPPCNISRIPRSLSVRKFWKAHEWYAWLCYYCLPIIQSYLPKKFISHLALLVDGVTLLLSDSIAPSELDHCDTVLEQFVSEFETLYGLRNVSFNVHLCRHLTDSVRAWGPLWAHSAFVYEAFNAKLLNMIKSTQAVPLQICKTFVLQRSLPMYVARVTSSDNCNSEYKAILESLIPSATRLQHSDSVGGVTFLGRSRLRQLNGTHLLAVHYVANHVPPKTVVEYHDRIIVHGEVIHSSYYCRNLRRNSSIVVLDDDSVFVVEHFVKANLGSGTDAFALGNQLQILPITVCSHPSIMLKLHHILPVSRIVEPLVAIRAKRIVRKCIFLHMPRKQYDIVCRQINLLEYSS